VFTLGRDYDRRIDSPPITKGSPSTTRTSPASTTTGSKRAASTKERQLADAARYDGLLHAWMRRFLDRWIAGGA
ncbi:MAG: hypothetical protein V3S27_10850, partial [Kiloniellales bacterium]